mmetsp:Transcript_13052/g.28378  ORF Transcript_13052/g.28378 Transcript_13052/m.28378 type:complete len:561 (-) Transcript_13052:83-1765(-)|eukprot:CAMPEP_0185844426 /NCGR_PEP_ID=MMETSP1354-20130828/598_1 /TAXON_ID=708628 /ORGANISM="Erythrolobus madagascarensis, Strain CCMP3276" /LENGTH=560 /DNA_ID=CAMNT_0028544091 /DNA_START=334 /DNA_END=2016 /DNA_ORIENTATION=-
MKALVLCAVVAFVLLEELCSGTTQLFQSEFAEGTLIISTPGDYELAENIVFNPNGRAVGGNSLPRPDQFTYLGGIYDPAAYGIGFFAAISIVADNVTLELNGFTLEQGVEHNLIQRFFALIELGSTPFLAGQGPHDFGNLTSPSNVVIRNGRLGFSSHHAIHGNLNENVLIENVIMEDWAVAAISLNGGRDVTVQNVIAGPNFKEIPVSALFSTAQFILRYVDALSACPLAVELGGVRPSIAAIQTELAAVIEETYQAVVVAGDPVQVPEIFKSKDGLVDGNVYGMVFNVPGVAVNGLFDGIASEEQGNVGISLKRILIKDVAANVPEIVTFQTATGTPQMDPVGSLFQALKVTNFEGAYSANIVSDAQLVVAKNILATGDACFAPSRLSITRNSISQETISWAEECSKSHSMKYVCGGDSLFHVNKGVFGLRLDGALNSKLRNVRITDIENRGELQHPICFSADGLATHPKTTEIEYRGAAARGLVMSSVNDTLIERVSVKNVNSVFSASTGVEMLFETTKILGEVTVENVTTEAPTATARFVEVSASASAIKFLTISP